MSGETRTTTIDGRPVTVADILSTLAEVPPDATLRICIIDAGWGETGHLEVKYVDPSEFG